MIRRSASSARRWYYAWHNVAYAAKPHERQTLDIVVPKEPAYPRAPLPVVMFVHGGAWQRGDKAGRLSANLSPTLAKSVPAIVVSINYRLSPEVQYPAHLEDAALARQWIHDNIDKYGGDKEQLIWVGHSAGAHIIMKMLMNPTKGCPPPRGVVGIAGVYNIVRMANASVYGGLVIKPVFGSNAQMWREASVMQPTAVLPDAGASPILLLNASEDLHLEEDSAELKQWLHDRGHDSVEHHTIAETNHLSILGDVTMDTSSKTTTLIVDFIKRVVIAPSRNVM
ncbi:carbohydrate esterase [Achlya hypogyna]|uniref:Carbohydrate esterase n=1 Tax=Achlya hypogyna TaxID=1202772 RepID=A0A1V9Y4Q6_ACHHY|nr:carbohydrate esterase [Achlya hypogyna]